MTSVLNVDTIAAKNGTSPVTLTKQSAAKSWLNFNASSGTPTARDSFNLSSITDYATGKFGPTLTNSMSNTTYSLSGETNGNTGDTFSGNSTLALGINNVITTTANTYEVAVYNNADVDAKYTFTQVFGDLA